MNLDPSKPFLKILIPTLLCWESLLYGNTEEEMTSFDMVASEVIKKVTFMSDLGGWEV